MLKKVEDFSECRCPACFQRVPLNKDGKIVTHYTTIKEAKISTRDKVSKRQAICPATGKDGKAYA